MSTPTRLTATPVIDAASNSICGDSTCVHPLVQRAVRTADADYTLLQGLLLACFCELHHVLPQQDCMLYSNLDLLLILLPHAASRQNHTSLSMCPSMWASVMAHALTS